MKTAIESLQAVFRWEHQFAVKMALPGKMPEALILRPQIDRGSGFQPVLRMIDERAKALSYFPGVCRWLRLFEKCYFEKALKESAGLAARKRGPFASSGISRRRENRSSA